MTILVPCSFPDYFRLMFWVPLLEKLIRDPEDKASLRQISMYLANGGATAAGNHFLKLSPRQFVALLDAFEVHGAEIANSGEDASNVRAYTRFLVAIARGEDAAPPDYFAEFRKEQGLPLEEDAEDVPEHS